MHLVGHYLDLLELTLTGAILDDIGYAPGESPSCRLIMMRRSA